MQTHLSESQRECARVRELFPADDHYAGVYDRHGLLTERTLPLADNVRALVDPVTPEIPDMPVPIVDLTSYDGLFGTDLLQQVSP